MTLRSKEKKNPGSPPSSLFLAVREPCFLPEEPGALGRHWHRMDGGPERRGPEGRPGPERKEPGREGDFPEPLGS